MDVKTLLFLIKNLNATCTCILLPDTQCTYNVTLRRVLATVGAVEKQ